MNLIEEIKSRVNIVDLATQLGLNPTRNDQIFSIYKSEKNRSLKLYRKTNSFYCYATGRGGDVINFFADYKKIENREAIMLLAKELLLDNGYKKLNQSIQHTISQERCSEIYYSLEKYCNGVDEKTLDYLTGPKRGLTEEIIKRFRLFSINSINGTIDNLINSFHLDELKASGLFNEDGRFVFTKHHIIIPYLNDEKIIYLRGRLLPESENNETSKYIGLSKKTAKRLFNLDSQKIIPENGELLICEGEFDTIRAVQNGYPAVGVPGVNNFPENGKELLGKYDAYICFDNDQAGWDGMQKVTDIIRKTTQGIFLKEHKDLTELLNSNGTVHLLKHPAVELKQIEPKVIKRSILKLVSAHDLMKKVIPELMWVVKELLPEGLIVLAGRPKVGKSFMAMNVAIAVANGGKALGKFGTNRNSVLYVALEDNDRRIKDRMSNILKAEYETGAPKNLYYLEEKYNLPKLNIGGIEELQKLLEDDPSIKLIIIDTLGRSIADKSRKDKDSYRADYEISSMLQEMAINKNICLLVLHHTKKTAEENVFDEISGTTGLTGAMDTMMVLKKKNNKYSLHITGRDVQETEYEVGFDENNFTWSVIDRKDDHRLTTERQEIVDLLKKYSRVMRTGEIASLLGKERSNVSKMLKKLVDDEIVWSPKYGVYDLVKIEAAKNLKTQSGDLIS